MSALPERARPREDDASPEADASDVNGTTDAPDAIDVPDLKVVFSKVADRLDEVLTVAPSTPERPRATDVDRRIEDARRKLRVRGNNVQEVQPQRPSRRWLPRIDGPWLRRFAGRVGIGLLIASISALISMLLL